jgi:uncharacterized protein (DUF433 family)
MVADEGIRMATLAYPHIRLQPDGEPYIDGSSIKVVEVIMDRLAYNWDADEIRRQHPELSLAQIHAALTYYYDHQPELDAAIEARLRREEELLSKLGTSPLRAKLQAAKAASWR